MLVPDIHERADLGIVQQEGYLQGPLEIYGEMELLRLLDQFFEGAIGYGAEGYESARTQMSDGEPPLAQIADGGKHVSHHEVRLSRW